MLKPDLLEKLRNLDEISLVELLGLTSDDIVDRFLDVIEDKTPYIYDQLED